MMEHCFVLPSLTDSGTLIATSAVAPAAAAAVGPVICTSLEVGPSSRRTAASPDPPSLFLPPHHPHDPVAFREGLPVL